MRDMQAVFPNVIVPMPMLWDPNEGKNQIQKTDTRHEGMQNLRQALPTVHSKGMLYGRMQYRKQKATRKTGSKGGQTTNWLAKERVNILKSDGAPQVRMALDIGIARRVWYSYDATSTVRVADTRQRVDAGTIPLRRGPQ